MRRVYLAVGLAVGFGVAAACTPEPADERSNGNLLTVRVSPSALSIDTGATQPMTATAVFQNGFNEDVTDRATWSVSGANATITPDGIVTAVAEGSVEVLAAFGGRTSTPALLTVRLGPTPTPSPSGACDTGVAVIITEVAHTPNAPQGETEFVEIMNTESVMVDISSYTIEDTDGATNIFMIPNPTLLAAGAGYVVSRGANALNEFQTEYAVTPDATGSSITLTSSDGILMKDCLGADVDVVSMNGATMPGQGWACVTNTLGDANQSIGRINQTDNDNCTDWQNQAAAPGVFP